MNNKNTTTRTTSKEEIDEMKNWLHSHSLPESLQLDEATYIPHLTETIDRLVNQAYICREIPNMQGCILLLRKIVALLKENG